MVREDISNTKNEMSTKKLEFLSLLTGLSRLWHAGARKHLTVQNGDLQNFDLNGQNERVVCEGSVDRGPSFSTGTRGRIRRLEWGAYRADGFNWRKAASRLNGRRSKAI
jgi:hypothetical protein